MREAPRNGSQTGVVTLEALLGVVTLLLALLAYLVFGNHRIGRFLNHLLDTIL